MNHKSSPRAFIKCSLKNLSSRLKVETFYEIRELCSILLVASQKLGNTGLFEQGIELNMFLHTGPQNRIPPCSNAAQVKQVICTLW